MASREWTNYEYYDIIKEKTQGDVVDEKSNNRRRKDMSKL